MTDRYELEQRLKKAEWVLNNSGFRRCDILACNCGSWHQVGGFKARFDEIREAVEDADYSTNGKILLDVVKQIIAEAKRSSDPAQAAPERGDLSDSPLPWVFDEGNGAGPDEKESLPCIADANGNIIMQIFLDDPYEPPRVAEKIAAMRVAANAVNNGVPDGLLMRLLHGRLSDYERIANSKLGLTDLGEHAYLAFKIFRDSCIAALCAHPTQGGDKGEAVAWQYKHESHGDDGWCMLKGGADPTEFLKQWPSIKYDIRALVLAAPQPTTAAPVAWIAFAGNGNVRFWTANEQRAKAEKERGLDLRAFTLAELVALAGTRDPAQGAPDLRSALQLLDSLDGIADNFRDVEPCRHNNDNIVSDLKIELAGLREALTVIGSFHPAYTARNPTDFSRQLRAWPSCEGHDAFNPIYVGELFSDAANDIDRLAVTLHPFAYYFDLNDCDDRRDDDAMEVPIRDLRAARDLLRSLRVDTSLPSTASPLPSPPATPTIDDVPSCGQENDYRRASPPAPLPAGEVVERAADGNSYRYHATGLPAGGDAPPYSQIAGDVREALKPFASAADAFTSAMPDQFELLVKIDATPMFTIKIGDLRKAKAVLALPQAQEGWRRIETAPKGGTNVLVCREMEDRSVGEAFFWEGAWRTWDGENHTRTSWIDGYLTHWRPMPTASSVSSAHRGGARE